MSTCIDIEMLILNINVRCLSVAIRNFMVRKKVSEDLLCLVFEMFDFLRQKLLTFFCFNITVLLNIWFASKY